MFYHYNNITDEELPVLTESYDDLNNNHIYYKSIMQSGISNKKRFEVSFSEKFQLAKDNDKTICDIVFPKKSTIRLFVLILLFIGLLYLGAWSFQMLERENEINQRNNFKMIRKLFLEENKCISDKTLEEFIVSVEKIKDMGLSAQHNASEDNWNIPTAVFFVTTLVTTIGYGNDKPLTVWGKIFCIAFIVIGLPTMMILATAVVERMFIFTELLFSSLCLRYKWKITEDRFREIEIVVCFLILIVGFIFIPALAFVKMQEGWSYLNSVYYCVISLTTIGLGDFVPGDSPDKARRDLLKILSTVYLFTGLLWASFCIQIFHRYHRWNIGAQFFYLENEYMNFKYKNFINSSYSGSEHGSQEVYTGSDTNLEPMEPSYLNSGRKPRCKSYS